MWELLTAKEGPWWGEAAIAGGFLIIGALISLITAAIVEAVKSRRELSRRFDAEIREAGAVFLTNADAYWEAEKEYAKVLARKPDSVEAGRQNLEKLSESGAVLNTARNAASKSLQPLSFVAPDPLIRAARRHYLCILATNIVEDSEGHSKEYWATRQQVVDQVRLTLKLPASKIGKKPWRKRLVIWLKSHGPTRKALKDITNDTGLLVVGSLCLLLAGYLLGR
ncbi:hypothetical protein [Arthrobacter sp. V1I9]|uniref:hypothetical protein n=1 Tax=Arthrobacter sp. V1I9 TaxID=3042275 RepID=UPI0027D86E70|nr:hypothetical protein [Arthrobacter sp. V1I9]